MSYPQVTAYGSQATVGGFLRLRTSVLRGQPFTDLIDEQDRPVLLAADTRHTLLCDGVDVGAVLDASIALAPDVVNAVIVIGCHLSDWKKANGFYLDPLAAGHQDRQAALYDLAAAKGLRVVYRALADVQGVSVGDQQRIVAMSEEVARGRWNAIHTTGNEGGKGDGGANGWNAHDFARPANMGGVLCGRGSFGMDTTPDPDHWDIAEWEPRRDPTHKALDDCGAGVFELIHGYEQYPHGVPYSAVFISEPPVFNESDQDWAGDRGRWTDPVLARWVGVSIAASGAVGGGFISSDGMVCRPLGPIATECGRQFFRGLRAGFVR